MRFQLIDDILERAADRIVAIKQVTAAEEYLADHFPGFPVLPGVLMIEALVQAARELMGEEGRRYVLGQAKAVRYGSFVRPGETLRVEVRREGEAEDGSLTFRGIGTVIRPARSADDATPSAETAVSGRFTMRPVRLERNAPAAIAEAT